MQTNRHSWTLAWSHGKATVLSLGAMLGPVDFVLDAASSTLQQRTVQPFSSFAWGAVCHPQTHEPISPLLAYGRGEWPCLPFGQAGAAADLGWEHPTHGLPAHSHWQRVDAGTQAHAITLVFDCPEPSPIARVERRIQGVPGRAQLHCSLSVAVRRACRLPLGLHPVLRMPVSVGQSQLLPGRFAFACSAPVALQAGRDRLLAGQRVSDLRQLKDVHAEPFGPLCFPLPKPTESLLQLCGCDGHMAVAYPQDKYQFELAWDASQLPSCLIWMSNAGRTQWPWNGAHYGLGIEPICSYFDLGVQASTATNPIEQSGIATALQFDPRQPWLTHYRMGVLPLRDA